MFLLTNASLFFPVEQVGSAVTVLTIYSILLLFGMIFYLTGQAKTDIFRLNTGFALLQFGLGFLVSAVIFVVAMPATIAASFDPLSGIAAVSFWGALIYIFNKAFIEEFVFRDILEDKVGRYGQAGLFGLFHVAILSAGGAAFLSVVGGAIFLSLLGLLWSFMKDSTFFGIIGATGSHTAWNAVATGLLKGVFGKG